METQGLGYCGLNCDTCPIFIASANNDDELRQKTVQELSSLYSDYLGKTVLTKKDMNCRGCLMEQSLFIGCKDCLIRECCRAKQFSTCASCADYSTCEILNGFYSVPFHQQAKDNLDKIRTY
jgi:hypothetical protein